MGDPNVKGPADSVQRAAFTRHLLGDLEALEEMLGSGRIESGVRRLGAEQEMFLVDRHLAVAPVGPEVLAAIGDPRLTSELACFNLEANLTPLPFGGTCLSDLHRELDEVIAMVRVAAAKHGADVLLVGILPTLDKRDASLQNMTPEPRYAALNDAMCRERGGRFHVHIRGVDELETSHDNVMLESSNTSFQLHLQVDPAEFGQFYNVAQVASAPVLAAAVNSPLFLRRRLWAETRVALFESSVDGRSEHHQERGGRRRVHFGDGWVTESVVEIMRDDVARFRVLVAGGAEEDARGVLARGGLPGLKALRLHGGTIYRWNRPCYGTAGGEAHLRIENRVLPAGPTTLDEVANAALFYGVVLGMAREHPRIHESMAFEDAKGNFIAAARTGLNAQLRWLGARDVGCGELILRELLPMARAALREAGVDAGDIARYLDVIEERVKSRQTGARWMIDSLAAMRDHGNLQMRMRSLTSAMLDHEKSGRPVHEWELARMPDDAPTWLDSLRTVGQVMSTDLFTVRPGDVLDLAASVMTWERVRHVPVESEGGELVGLISYWSLLRLVARGGFESADPPLVESVMRKDPITVDPSTATLAAVVLMQKHRVSCLPVVEDGRLVGILTDRDLIQVTRRLLEDQLRAAEPDATS